MNATERGLNPYTHGGIAGAADSPNGRTMIDPRATGLDGDVLDQLLKGRWQEGHETGYGDGHTAARSRYAPIYDEAFAAGEESGFREEGRVVQQVLLASLERLYAAFGDIGQRTGSKDVKALCGAERAAISSILETFAGRYSTGVGVDEGMGAGVDGRR